MFTKVQTAKVDQPCSAQFAESKALTATCNPTAGKRLDMYTDSAHAFGVCRVFGRKEAFVKLMAHQSRIWRLSPNY